MKHGDARGWAFSLRRDDIVQQNRATDQHAQQ
jgi:hypothetical protein